MRRLVHVVGGIGLAILLSVGGGCAGWRAGTPPLRVGISPDYEPLAFRQDGRLAGAEVAFAEALGLELGRAVQFVEIPWNEQIPALLAGRTDIIMSGLSVTPERAQVVSFCEPYLGNNLYALVRRDRAGAFPTAESLRTSTARIGVLPDTTADSFVRTACPGARAVSVKRAAEAPGLLARGELDAFVDDGWSVASLLVRDEAALALVKGPLQEETLAWAVRPQDGALRDAVNAALATWREDGRWREIVRRWLPHIDRLQ